MCRLVNRTDEMHAHEAEFLIVRSKVARKETQQEAFPYGSVGQLNFSIIGEIVCVDGKEIRKVGNPETYSARDPPRLVCILGFGLLSLVRSSPEKGRDLIETRKGACSARSG